MCSWYAVGNINDGRVFTVLCGNVNVAKVDDVIQGVIAEYRNRYSLSHRHSARDVTFWQSYSSRMKG